MHTKLYTSLTPYISVQCTVYTVYCIQTDGGAVRVWRIIYGLNNIINNLLYKEIPVGRDSRVVRGEKWIRRDGVR